MTEENIRAKVKVTLIGKDGHSFDIVASMSTDLPDEAMGTMIGETLREAWKRGEDPAYSTIVITFDKFSEVDETISEEHNDETA